MIDIKHKCKSNDHEMAQSERKSDFKIRVGESFIEPRYEKTNSLHTRKQRRRSAVK